MSAQDKIDGAVDRVRNDKKDLLARIESPASLNAIVGVHPLLAALAPEQRMAAAQRLARVAYMAATKNPTLLKCAPESIVAGVVEAAQLGLSVDGVLGHAYLVPYFDRGTQRAQMQIGYRGFISLAYRSERIERIAADVVCENDLFDFEEGTSPRLTHKKSLTQDRGNTIGAYAIAQLKGTTVPLFRVMPMAELLAHRERSSGYQAFKQGKIKSTPWDTDADAMAMKTALRMLAKFLPLEEMQRASTYDEARDQGRTQAPRTVADVLDMQEDEVEDGAAATV